METLNVLLRVSGAESKASEERGLRVTWKHGQVKRVIGILYLLALNVCDLKIESGDHGTKLNIRTLLPIFSIEFL